MKVKHIVFVLCLASGLFSFSEGNAKNASFYAPGSMLSTGKWVKVRVYENAIYKLTYEDIQSFGIDPARAGVYGYGGWALDMDFSKNNYVDDLPEVPVWISGSDNVLNPGEFLLFYGKGHTKWSVASPASEGAFIHENNPYSDHGYYFIGERDSPPKTPENAPAESTGTVTLNTFNDYALHERDLITIISSGRELYGENFSSNRAQTFNFNINNIVPGNVTAEFRFLSTIKNTSVSVSADQKFIGTFNNSSTEANVPKAYPIVGKAIWTAASGTLSPTLTYSHPGNNAYLDYIRLFVKRHLRPDGAYTFFRNVENIAGNCTYTISNTSPEMFVLELTEGKEIKKMSVNSGSGTMSFHANRSSVLREFVLINPSGSFPIPEFAGEISSQNLHALPQQDLLIITRPVYLEEAGRLAEKHVSHSGLKVAVVTAEQVYNEFSSGTPDATAYRRLMKMFYDRAASESDQPKYLLLFGDGSFDNRMLTDQWRQMPRDYYLLTFQSANSIRLDNASFVTDDYFGYLSDSNNQIADDKAGTLQLGIGRLPVKSVAEARDIVNKEIGYMENRNPGIWKNQLVFIAGDDSDPKNLHMHVRQTDTMLTRYVDRTHPEYMISKVYYDAFNRSSAGGGVSYPDAQRKLDKKLKEGTFLVNYVGHGGIGQIARNMVSSSSASKMSYASLPLWMMATCDVGWWDGVSNSLSELLLLNPASGGIAVISASRVVYSNYNVDLNEKIVQQLFAQKNNSYQRLGDIVRNAKNGVPSDNLNKLCYSLLGDPALKLAYPESTVCVDSINGLAVGSSAFQLKARETVTLKGHILDAQGAEDGGFTGKIRTVVLDAPQQLSTQTPDKDGNIWNFTEYANNPYAGTSSVVNGAFTVRFVVPVDISHSDTPGKMSLYAYNEADGRDAKGSFTQFFLKGVAESDGTAPKPPQIHSLYLNTPFFESDPVVNEQPYFIVEVSDSMGINKSGAGIGHNIVLTIDNKPRYTYTLNDYFTEDEDNPGHGSIYFSIPDSLPAGNHTLTFKVWNILNMSATREVAFVVEAGKSPVIYTLNASPNPARTSVDFTLYHDPLPMKMNERDVANEVKVTVFDLTGRVVWESEPVAAPGQEEHWVHIPPITWNLVSNTGNRVKPGVYLYKAMINSNAGRETTASRKLIVLGQ
jgi:hypothetical protein